MSKLQCPACNKEVSGNPFKTWHFRGYEVKRYECLQCKAKFNLYQGAGKTFTIPKGK
jgi:hypothetical protein